MKHNHLAILVGVIAYNVTGFLWHAPFSFIGPWAAGIGADPAALSEPNPVALISGFVGAFIVGYTMSWLIQRLSVSSGGGGARIGGVIWLGFVMPLIAINYLFVGIGFGAIWVDGLNALMALVIMGFVIGAWQTTAMKERQAAVTSTL